MLEMDYLSWSRHYRNFPGQGDLPVLEFMQALSVTGYDGALSLEIFNDDMRAAPPRQTAADGHRSLLFLEERVRQGWLLSREKTLELFALDVELNAQGLEFWLDASSAPEGKIARNGQKSL